MSEANARRRGSLVFGSILAAIVVFAIVDFAAMDAQSGLATVLLVGPALSLIGIATLRSPDTDSEPWMAWTLAAVGLGPAAVAFAVGPFL